MSSARAKEPTDNLLASSGAVFWAVDEYAFHVASLECISLHYVCPGLQQVWAKVRSGDTMRRAQ